MNPKLLPTLTLVASISLSLTYANPIEGDTNNVGDTKINTNNEQVSDLEALVKEWNESKNSIYNPDVVLEPEETLKLFKRLAEIFPRVKSLIPERSTRYLWEGRFEDIVDGVAVISSEKCTPNELVKMESKIAVHCDYESPEKLLSYLKGKQYAVCKAKFDPEFKEILQNLPPIERDNIAQIANEVLKYDRKYGEPASKMPTFTFNGLTRGSFEFLKQKNPDLSKKVPREEYKKLFNSSILDLCTTVGDKIKVPIGFYKNLVTESKKEVDTTVDQEISDWLIRDRICKRLIENKKSHFEVAYEILRGLRKHKERLIDPEVIAEREREREYMKERVEQMRARRYGRDSGSNGKGFNFWSIFCLAPPN